METIHTKEQQLHIAMFPWFAKGHITANMHLANNLADQGHRISFFLPSKAQPLFSQLNSHPDLITLIPVPLPQLPGLDPDIQTTADCNCCGLTHHLFATAIDRTAPFIESSLLSLKPQVVFYDIAQWVPQITKKMGILAVMFFITSPAYLAHSLIPRDKEHPTESEIRQLPPDFPHPCLVLHKFEAREACKLFVNEYGEGVTFMRRLKTALMDSDAIVVKTWKNLGGHYLDYIKKQTNKPVFTAGQTIPTPPPKPLKGCTTSLWLKKFESKSVIYCAFGSECHALSLGQFQELLLGIELTGLPFLIALKPPTGVGNIELALPEGFQHRTGERGIVTGEWVPQPEILAHDSVGCFVTHCGWGSFTEGLMGKCQLVLMPRIGDQLVNARLMSGDLKVGVEVRRREEDGAFDRYGVCEAVKVVMNVEDGVGKEVKMNYDRWRRVLLGPGLERACVDELVTNLQQLVM
uniref:Glycosyltransferase n=1 Tax=Kalanchoe fedtschenkoi TaxID=63787 RepID=A0A7N0UG85_KALFE